MYTGANGEDALSVDMEGDSINAMQDTSRLIRVAVPDVSATAQQKGPTAVETAHDLTGLGEGGLGANIWHQLPRKDFLGPPILDSDE
jgi:hypothetical protein